MGKNLQSKKSGKTSKTKFDTAIVVAMIGLIGTLLTALLASPVLIAWIQKTNSPINVATETPAPLLPIVATNTAIYTASLLPAPTSTLTPTPIGQDWKSIISIRLSSSSGCYARLLPPTINPNDDISVAAQQFTQAYNNNEAQNWLIAPDQPNKNISIGLHISSVVADSQWIKLSNKLIIEVTAQKDLPEHVNVIDYGVCGGEGEIRTFSAVGFSNNFDTYEERPIYTGADFFTLQPGEFEEFDIPIECQAAGIYYAKVNVAYEYSNFSGVTNSDETIGFICPQTFTIWDFDIFGHHFLSSETYQWNGNGYDKKP